jgi:hypothetical protein
METALLPGRPVQQAHAVARRDEQPVAGLAASDLAVVARPVARGRSADEPGLAIGRGSWWRCRLALDRRV